MPTEPTIGQPSTPDSASLQEQQPTPVDLARSWLGHRRAQAQLNIFWAKSIIDSSIIHDQATPSESLSNGGNINMDDLATRQLLDVEKQMIADKERELEILEDQQIDVEEEVSEQMLGVDSGDAALIDRLAKLEIARLEKIESDKREREETKKAREEGYEAQGTDEVVSIFSELFSLAREHKLSAVNVGLGGWDLVSYSPGVWEEVPGDPETRNPGTLYFHYKSGEGPKGQFVVSALIMGNSKTDYQINILDFREPEEIPNGYKNHDMVLGTSVEMTVKQGKERVFSPRIGPGIVHDTESGLGWRVQAAVEPGERVDLRKKPFDQSRFDEMKALVSALATDIKNANIDSEKLDVAPSPETIAEKPGLVTTSAAEAIDSVLKDKAVSVWEEVDISVLGRDSVFFSFFDAGQAAKFDKAAGAFAAWYSKALEAHENLYQNPEGDRLAAELRALEPRFKGRFPSRIYGDGHWITEPQKLLDAEFYAKQMEAPSHEDDEAAEAAGWAAYYAEIDANEEALRRLEEAREEDDEDRDEGAPSNSMGYEAAPFGEEDDEREAMAEITGDKAWIVAVGDRALKIAEGDGRKFPEGPDFTTARLDLRDILPQSEKDELDRELRAVEEGRPAGSN